MGASRPSSPEQNHTRWHSMEAGRAAGGSTRSSRLAFTICVPPTVVT
jgi:hypothetical protein